MVKKVKRLNGATITWNGAVYLSVCLCVCAFSSFFLFSSIQLLASHFFWGFLTNTILDVNLGERLCKDGSNTIKINTFWSNTITVLCYYLYTSKFIGWKGNTRERTKNTGKGRHKTSKQTTNHRRRFMLWILTRLDSSGDAKLSRSTLTLTVNVSAMENTKICWHYKHCAKPYSYLMIVKRIECTIFDKFIRYTFYSVCVYIVPNTNIVNINVYLFRKMGRKIEHGTMTNLMHIFFRINTHKFYAISHVKRVNIAHLT